MFETADALVAYRSYPHVDMAETGARAARLLERMLKTGSKLAHRNRGFDFLTGIPSQSSFIEPGRSLYRELGVLENSSDTVLSFTPGFPMADFDECGMAVFGYGSSQKDVDAAVEKLRAAVADSEGDFALELHLPDDAVKRAMARGEPGVPVVLADTQDNPGAGGNGDTTGLLAALVRQNAREAVVGLLIDSESALRAHQAGQGAPGLRWRTVADSGRFAFTGEFTVERPRDGRFTCTGPMFRGFRCNSVRWQCCAAAPRPGVALCCFEEAPAADWRCSATWRTSAARARSGPEKLVYFRADFEPIAREVLVVKAARAGPREFQWTSRGNADAPARPRIRRMTKKAAALPDRAAAARPSARDELQRLGAVPDCGPRPARRDQSYGRSRDPAGIRGTIVMRAGACARAQGLARLPRCVRQARDRAAGDDWRAVPQGAALRPGALRTESRLGLQRPQGSVADPAAVRRRKGILGQPRGGRRRRRVGQGQVRLYRRERNRRDPTAVRQGAAVRPCRARRDREAHAPD